MRGITDPNSCVATDAVAHVVSHFASASRHKNTAPGQRGGETGKGAGEDTDNEMIPQTEDEKGRIKSNQRDFNRII